MTASRDLAVVVEAAQSRKDQQQLPLLQGEEVNVDAEATPQTNLRSWLRLAVAFAACVVCGGIIPGQALFTQLFAEAGIFQQVCADASGGNETLASHDGTPCPEQYLALANTFGMLQSFALMALLPAGIIFDTFGGRLTGVIGAVLLASGVVVICASLQLALSHSEDAAAAQFVLFPIGVLLTDFGGLINSYCLFSFLFHLPGWNGLLVALSNSVYYIAAVLPFILKWLMSEVLLPAQVLNPESSQTRALQLALLIYGVGAVFCVCVPLYLLIVPAQKEYYQVAQKALGMPIPRPSSAGGILRCLQAARKDVRVAVRSLTFKKEYLPKHGFMLLAGSIGYLSCFVYISLPQPFGDALFLGGGGSSSGDRSSTTNASSVADKSGADLTASPGTELANFMTTSLIVLGSSLGPLAGVVIDKTKFGLGAVVYTNAMSLLITAACCFLATWPAQELACVGANVLQVTNTTVLMKYILAFASPTRIGTVTGVFVIAFTVISIPFLIAVSILIEELGPGDGGSSVFQYAAPTSVFCVAGAVTFIILGGRLVRGEMLPKEPPLLPEDELELSRRFMVGTLADACDVTELERGELLRLSASQDVKDMRFLSKRVQASYGRLVKLAIRKAAEGQPDADATSGTALPRETAVDKEASQDPSSASRSRGMWRVAAKPWPEFNRTLEDGWSITDREASLAFATRFFADAMWPPQSAEYEGSPIMEWMSGGFPKRCADSPASMLGTDSSPKSATQAKETNLDLAADSPKSGASAVSILGSRAVEEAFLQGFLWHCAMGYHCGRRFGHILEMRDSHDAIGCLLLAMPPGATGKVGSFEYYYGIAQAAGGAMGAAEAGNTMGGAEAGAEEDDGMMGLPRLPVSLQMRELAMHQVSDENRPEQPHWYVQLLATAGTHRGRRCAKRLLDVVQEWAKRDGVFVYLETDGDTATKFYERPSVGFKRVWEEHVTGDDSDTVGLTVVGMEKR